jgi:zinc protease
VERVGEINLDRSMSIYTEAVSQASSWTIVISGDFDGQKARELAKTWLASLPKSTVRTWKDNTIRPLAGPVQSVVKKGEDNKSTITMMLWAEQPWAPKDRFTVNILRSILDIELRLAIREDKGGTYGVSSNISASPYPWPSVVLSLNFSCEPGRRDELVQAAKDRLALIAAGKFGADTFAKAKEMGARSVEEAEKSNSYWVGAIDASFQRDLPLLELASIKAGLAKVSTEEVQAYAARFIDPAKALTVILEPSK